MSRYQIVHDCGRPCRWDISLNNRTGTYTIPSSDSTGHRTARLLFRGSGVWISRVGHTDIRSASPFGVGYWHFRVNSCFGKHRRQLILLVPHTPLVRLPGTWTWVSLSGSWLEWLFADYTPMLFTRLSTSGSPDTHAVKFTIK